MPGYIEAFMFSHDGHPDATFYQQTVAQPPARAALAACVSLLHFEIDVVEFSDCKRLPLLKQASGALLDAGVFSTMLKVALA